MSGTEGAVLIIVGAILGATLVILGMVFKD